MNSLSAHSYEVKPAPRLAIMEEPPEPATFYLALAGVEILDIGGPLLPFLRGLMEAWPDLGQDIALWQVHGDAIEPDAWSEDGDPPRLVGVLRPTPTGPAVTWL
jgi:hypothetical protein